MRGLSTLRTEKPFTSAGCAKPALKVQTATEH
jgi:hypothetical protein